MDQALFDLSFVKAHGLGNDFVIIDDEDEALKKYEDSFHNLAQFLADRRYGVGCDQVILANGNQKKGFSIRFFNADGSEAEACGNGTRCVALYLMERIGADQITVSTAAGDLFCKKTDAGSIAVELAYTQCIQGVNLEEYNRFSQPPAVYVELGNPHLVCFVEKLTHGQNLGATLEQQLGRVNPHMPDRVNVGFAKVVDPSTLALLVYERGVGFTPACGTGACAAAIAAFSYGLVGNNVAVIQEGGTLHITLDDAQKIWMTGPACLVFQGVISITESCLEGKAVGQIKYQFYGATIQNASICTVGDSENTFVLTADFGEHGIRQTEVSLPSIYKVDDLKGFGIVGILGENDTFTVLAQHNEKNQLILEKKPLDVMNGEEID